MKKVVELVKDISNRPNGKAALFFCGYLLFFLCVFLLIKFAGRKDALIQEYEKGDTYKIKVDSLVKNNFAYDLKVIVDGKTYDYYGKRFNANIELFKFNNLDYYRNGDDFYVNMDDVWTVTESPYKYYDFIFPEIIVDILGEASFYSEEELDDSINYTLKISSNTLNKIFYDKNTDFDEVPNTIVVNSSDRIIKRVTYDLNSFCKLNNLCNNSMKITTTFDMYGDIKKIDNPIK